MMTYLSHAFQSGGNLKTVQLPLNFVAKIKPMGKVNSKSVILLNVDRGLSVAEIGTMTQVGEAAKL